MVRRWRLGARAGNPDHCAVPAERGGEREGGRGMVGGLLPAMVVVANRWSADREPGQETWITVLYLQRERETERERETDLLIMLN